MREKALTAIVFVLLIGLFAWAAADWRLPWKGKAAEEADWCEEHGVAESKCEICHPELARGGTVAVREREPKEGECANTLVRVTLGPGVAKAARLELHAADLRPVAETLKANAETLYPPSQYARVAPRLPGIVREVKATLGQDVEAGAPLAVLESTEFGQAKSDYLQALGLVRLREKTCEQEKTLVEKRISAGRELLAAETELGEAKLGERRAFQRLIALGLAAEQIKEVAERQDLSPAIEVRAPFAGKVVEAAAVAGEMASPDKPLFSVAATERLWISIDLYEADLLKVEKDQKVFFLVEGFPDKRFPGRILAVGGEVDDRTRTVRVYADVKNLDGLLRAKMFGRAEIAVKPPEPRLLVPKESVQNDGDCNLVFVSTSKDVFQARKVHLGTVYEGGYEIAGGLAAGEKVVTRGSFLLKTEVLRGQMGAG
jgi:cobalt-zinc-cadmium efflux system membrane fusion protein